MTWKEFIAPIKSFFNKGLSEDGSISSKRVVLFYTALVLWTFVHVYVFVSPLTDKTAMERDSLINFDFWIIVSGTGMVLGEKFTNKSSLK